MLYCARDKVEWMDLKSRVKLDMALKKNLLIWPKAITAGHAVLTLYTE